MNRIRLNGPIFMRSELRRFIGNILAKRLGQNPLNKQTLNKRVFNQSDQDYIRCTTLNLKGDITIHGDYVKRIQFLKSNNLVPRDLRKISRHYHGSTGTIKADIVPSLSTRNDCILVNLLNIRGVIKHNSVVIFDNNFVTKSLSTKSHSHSQSIFLEKLSGHLKSNDESLPYEFKALESILIHVMENLTTEMNVHKTVLYNILSGLDKSIDLVKLRYLLIQSKKVTQFHQKASLIRDLLDDLLEKDDELNELYLTEKFHNIIRQGNDHAEIEMILESYLKTNDAIVQTVEDLKSQIKTTEEIINVVLDSNRNELMLIGLKFSTGILSMGIALYVAALYGMNLENFIEETDGGFECVVIIGSIFMAILFMFSVKKLRNVGKMTMTGMHRKNPESRRN